VKSYELFYEFLGLKLEDRVSGKVDKT